MSQPPEEGTPTRQFKGLWVCAHLLDAEELTPAEKLLIAEVDSLSGNGQPCFAGNEHLAKRLHVAPAHMRGMLAELTDLGYLVRLAFTGRTTLRCVNPDLSSDPLAAKE